MRITLVISSLGPGGAERVMSNLANYWSAKGHDVTLVSLAEPGQDHYALHGDIVRISAGFFGPPIGMAARVLSVAKRMVSLRRTIIASEPHVVVSFVDKTNVRVLLSLLKSPVPIVVSERSNPLREPLASIWHFLRRHLYRRAAMVVVQTVGVQKWASDFLLTSKIRVIPNAVPASAYQSGNEGVVAVGRMHPQKGFDLLLRAWQQVQRAHPNVQLTLVGNGPMKAELETQSKDMGIAQSVTFVGKQADPHKVMAEHQIYVMSSRWEGFPNALLEAMACGLVPVSFDCDFGPRDIISHEQNGLLVPDEDVDGLARSLIRLLDDPATTRRLAGRVMEINERLAPEQVMTLWDDLLNEVVDD